MSARIIIAILGIMLPFPINALGVPDAMEWILSQQNHDGSWGDQAKGIEYQVHVTSEVLNSLTDSKDGSPNNASELARLENFIEKGEVWLKPHKPTDTLGFNSYMRALEVDSFSMDLIEYQNEDGGWGMKIGFRSTPWYTANALLALNSVSNMEGIGDGVDYLIATQESDGSWENTATATSAAIMALAHVYSIKHEPRYLTSARKGENWLFAKQGGNGEWFDASSTAAAVSALKTMYSYFRTQNQRPSIDRGRAFLMSAQRDDGSWGASPSSSKRAFCGKHPAFSVKAHGRPSPGLRPGFGQFG